MAAHYSLIRPHQRTGQRNTWVGDNLKTALTGKHVGYTITNELNCTLHTKNMKILNYQWRFSSKVITQEYNSNYSYTMGRV